MKDLFIQRTRAINNSPCFALLGALCLSSVHGQALPDLGAAGYTRLAPGVEGARILSTPFGDILKYRYTMAGRPFDTSTGYAAGPQDHDNTFGDSRRFFLVRNGSSVPGTVWQNLNDSSIKLTWFGANRKTPTTTNLPNPSSWGLAAATSDESGNIYYVTFQPGSGVPSTPWGVSLTKVNSAGAQIATAAMNTATSPGLDIVVPNDNQTSLKFSNGKLALMMGRTIARGGDGLNHQVGLAAVFDATTLAMDRNWGDSSSHSWDSHITVNADNEFVAVDVGDNFPRGLNLHKFTGAVKSNRVVANFKTLHGTQAVSPAGTTFPVYTAISGGGTTFFQWSNDNRTYTELGGVVQTPLGYAVAFASERAPSAGLLDSSRTGANLNDPRNIGLVTAVENFESASAGASGSIVTDDLVVGGGAAETGGYFDFFGGWTPQRNKGITWLTNYSSTTQNASRPKIHPRTDGNLLLLWELWGPSSYLTTRAMTVAPNGTIVHAETDLGTAVRLNRRDDLFGIGNSVFSVSGNGPASILELTVIEPTSAAVEDPYEENDSLAAAFDLTAVPGGALAAVNGPGAQHDDDWFKVNIPAGQPLIRASLGFDHGFGNIDLQLVNGAGVPLATSAGTGNTEFIEFQVASPGSYYLRVHGANLGTSYNLNWQTSPADDSYEQNDSIATAFDLSSSSGLQLSAIAGMGVQLDDDFYRIVAGAGSLQVKAECLFAHAAGNLDLALLDAAGAVVFNATSATDNEKIDFVVPAPGTYYLKVSGPGTATPYNLRWSASAPVFSEGLAHWKFDETNGTVARDSTINGRNANFNLGSPTWTGGTKDGALAFDGNDDLVTSSNLGVSTNSITFTAWVKRAGSQPFLSAIVSAVGGTTAAALHINNNHGGNGVPNPDLQLAYRWKDQQWWANSGLIVPDGVWTFVALAVSPTQATLYMDPGSGIQSFTNTTPHAAEAFDCPITLGRDAQFTTGRGLSGAVDDVRIIGRTLTQAEIEAIRDAGSTLPVPLPTLTSITPNTGSTAGGTSVTLTGTNFTGATSVTFGGTAATNLVVVNATTITCITPARPAGAASVLVTTPGGTNVANTLFTYIAPPSPPTLTSITPNTGSTAGGTNVTLTGTNFTGTTGVTFGGTAATNLVVVNATTITCITPARTAGTASVLVTTPGGTNAANTLFTYIAPQPTPANDHFAAAQLLTGNSGTVTGSNVDATKEPGEANHANNAGGRSVWYLWTAPNSGVATIDTLGSNFDTLLAVYTGAAVGGLTEVASNDDDPAGGVQSKLTFNAVAGTAYRIAVDGFSGATGGITLNYSVPVPLPTLTSITPNTGSTAGGTSVTLTGTNFTGATGVTFGGTAATNLVVVNATTITCTTPARTAGTASVLVTTPGGTNVANTLFTYIVPQTTPANDNFAGAQLLTGNSGTVTGSNADATKEPGEANHAGNAGGRSVWYLWTAPNSGVATIDTLGSNFDTLLAVYTGTAVSGLTGVANNDDDPAGGVQSKLTFNAVAGTAYRIAVDGFSGATGAITLNYSLAQALPVITSAGTANGSAGQAFSYQITASNSPTSYGATGLPSGLSVNPSSGLISGNPTTPGVSNVTISATNGGGTGSSGLVITVLGAVAGNPWNGLSGWWRLNEGTGTLATDSSGNGHNATLTSGTNWTTGRLGAGLAISGNGQMAATSADKTIPAALTITAWMRRVDTTGIDTIFSFGNKAAFRTMGSGLRFTTFGILDHDSAEGLYTAGEWTHVAVSFVPNTAGGVRFYVNGQFVEALNSSLADSATTAWQIGATPTDANEWFGGDLDDIRLYTRVLTDNEIAQVAGFTSPFDQWRADRFPVALLPDPNLSGPDGDPDRDGIRILMEYALSLDPNLPEPLASRVTHDIETLPAGDFLRLSVQRNPLATDVSYSILGSSHLGGWSPDNVVIETNTPGLLQGRNNLPVGEAIRSFLRLQVTQP